MSANPTDQTADPGKTAVQGDVEAVEVDQPAEATQQDALAWFWSLYDVLSASHRELPTPPWPRPE